MDFNESQVESGDITVRREISKATPHFTLVPVQWRIVRRKTCLIPADVDRHAVRKAIPGFSGSPDPTDSSPTSADVDRHLKRKMATVKPEVVTYHVLKQIDTRFESLFL